MWIKMTWFDKYMLALCLVYRVAWMTKVLSQYKFYWSKQTIDGSKVDKVPIRHKDFLAYGTGVYIVLKFQNDI